MSISITELQDKEKRLRKEVEESVQKFRDETGVDVSRLNASFHKIESYGTLGSWELTSVDIELDN